MWLRFRTLLAGCSIAGLLAISGAVMAGEDEKEKQAEADQPRSQAFEDSQTAGEDQTYQQDQAAGEEQTYQQDQTAGVAGNEQELAGPAEDVQESAEVLAQLREQEPELAQKVTDAKGVFIIPDYATAALLVGGSGGEGVLMTQENGEWGNPGFYDVGNIDIGAQAGAAAGALVMVLMTDAAVENFKSKDTEFSLTAQAGLTLINWSAQVPETMAEGDVLVWSDTEGLIAEASVGVGGISWDEDEVREYYNQAATPEEVLAGTVQNPHEGVLQTEFAQFTGEGGQQPQQERQSQQEPDFQQESEIQQDPDIQGDPTLEEDPGSEPDPLLEDE